MSKQEKKGLVPKLRFLEFRDAGNWAAKQIGHVSETVTTGGTPSTSEKEYWGGNIRWMNSGELNYKKVYEVQGRITENGLRNSSTKIIPKMCVLIGLAGQGKTRGTVAMNMVELCINQSIAAIFPNEDNFSSEFLYHNLDNRYDELRSLSAGGEGRGGLNLQIIKSLRVPLPSLKEQQKIADCLTSLDELITAQTQKLDALKIHKKGLMQQLFPAEGETVPKLRFPEFRDKGEWVEKKLDDLFHFQDGFAFKSTDFVDSNEEATQVIRITDINNKNTNTDKVFIPNAYLEANGLEKYFVKNGDLLLSLTGAAGFNFFFWNGPRSMINQRTAKVLPKQKIDSALVRLLEPLVHYEINARGEGQNNNLSKEFLSSVTLLIPQPAEQQKIADCLTSVDELITNQSKKVEALKAHKKGLMQQLFPAMEEVGA